MAPRGLITSWGRWAPQLPCRPVGGELLRSGGNDGMEASPPCKPDDVDNQMNETMTTSRLQAGYQNPKKHLILAQFSNSQWTADGHMDENAT